MKFNNQLNVSWNQANNSEYKNFKLNDFKEANKNAVMWILSIDKWHYLSEMKLADIFWISEDKKQKIAAEHWVAA